MNARGQALVEYALIVFVITTGLWATQYAMGDGLWHMFLDKLGVYNTYNGSFEALLAAPFP